MTILLIEFDSDLRRQYALGLKQAGFEVIAANSAQAALDALDEAHIDLVVTEISLPVHNGITVMLEMLSYRDWSKIPIVVLSLLPQADFGLSDERWQELNVVRYLNKQSTRPDVLTKAIKEQL